jgi:preprotein translocase subunit SecE
MSKKMQVNTESNFFDKLLWLIVAVLLLSGVIANYRFSQLTLTIRLIGWIVLACIVILIALQTVAGKQFWKFFKDSKNEMRRVVWPTRQQTFHQTLLVTGIVIVFAVLMWSFDSIIQWALHFVIGS